MRGAQCDELCDRCGGGGGGRCRHRRDDGHLPAGHTGTVPGGAHPPVEHRGEPGAVAPRGGPVRRPVRRPHRPPPRRHQPDDPHGRVVPPGRQDVGPAARFQRGRGGRDPADQGPGPDEQRPGSAGRQSRRHHCPMSVERLHPAGLCLSRPPARQGGADGRGYGRRRDGVHGIHGIYGGNSRHGLPERLSGFLRHPRRMREAGAAHPHVPSRQCLGIVQGRTVGARLAHYELQRRVGHRARQRERRTDQHRRAADAAGGESQSGLLEAEGGAGPAGEQQCHWLQHEQYRHHRPAGDTVQVQRHPVHQGVAGTGRDPAERRRRRRGCGEPVGPKGQAGVVRGGGWNSQLHCHQTDPVVLVGLEVVDPPSQVPPSQARLEIPGRSFRQLLAGLSSPPAYAGHPGLSQSNS
mmetsp:Transcript_29706/g.86573  ORF Transcript_29706/g.86573 Transcript_29706/m.86573 type:complete len:408 (-) Transcript_29706:2147-3370(-)